MNRTLRELADEIDTSCGGEYIGDGSAGNSALHLWDVTTQRLATNACDGTDAFPVFRAPANSICEINTIETLAINWLIALVETVWRRRATRQQI